MQAEVLAAPRRDRALMSAYDVLGQLRQSGLRLAPPTMYRAPAALTERGRAHRFESLNAFMACQRDQHHHASMPATCGDCGSAEEDLAPGLGDEMPGIAGKSGFVPARHVIEVHR